ncbi:MAG: DUF134 domain-containing protein [Archaeoglobaceae archaeon]|nr:DUF134 domain-containing protein [Archaeoglobaceae archaeon]
MPRRKRRRWVFIDPPEFNENSKIEISLDEIEALRLADVEGLNQLDAARIMGISQPTFHRILRNARKKAGMAIVYGFGVKIVGGEHVMRKFRCFDCGYEWEEPFGTGRPMQCPKCGSTNFCRQDAGRGKRRRGRW